MIFCRYFYSFSLIFFCGMTLDKFSLLIKFLREKRRQVVTGTRRRQTAKNGAIIGRKKESCNKTTKIWPSVCVCEGRIETRQSQEIEVYDGRRQRALSHRKRERAKRDAEERESESARGWKSARAFVMTSISLWGIPGFMLMRSSWNSVRQFNLFLFFSRRRRI